MSSDNSKYIGKTISTISNDNYLTKYDILKNCQDNPTINSLLLQIEKNTENFDISKIVDGLKEQVNYDYNNIYTINLKNLLEIINQVYKIRANRVKKQILGSYTKGTLETDLISYLKSKYGLKKLIIEWNINILSSIKAYSKINGEVCLFGLILRNELDEGSIDILYKIKETIDGIIKPLYRYNNNIINNIKNNKEFMNENEWLIIAQILYNNDNNLRQRFQNKIYIFIKKFIKNDKILEKNGKKILFGDFLNQLIMFNLRLRKKYLNNLSTFFKRHDKNRYGLINHDEFKLMMENMGIIQKDKFKEVIDYLIGNTDKECSGLITFNDIVICFDNFYLDSQNENNNEEKVKLLDKINNLNLN
jgi:Ca2+-binding EF-hand superfamily protein